MDTSLEKASLYLQAEESISDIDVTSLVDTLSDWPAVTTGKEHSIGRSVHFVVLMLAMFLVAFILLIVILSCFSLLVCLCLLLQ
jgi:hypothetical protein